MDWNANHAGFVIASYAMSFVFMAGLIIYIFNRDARVRKLLAQFEKDKKVTPEPARRQAWPCASAHCDFCRPCLVFWKGLSGNPSNLPSALIGKPVPDFSLPAIRRFKYPRPRLRRSQNRRRLRGEYLGLLVRALPP